MDKIQKKVISFIEDLKEEPPINIFAVLKHLNIDFYERKLPEKISGILNIERDVTSPTKQKVSIITSPDIKWVRAKFIIAHEIGHYLFDYGYGTNIDITHVDSKTYFKLKKDDFLLLPMEKEASRFALELLMPTIFMEQKLKKVEDLIDTDEDIVKNLADIFEVTTTMMAIRLNSFI